tara:strand:- start:5356 stop:5631 length:276 start_codon:yes stop_codon:yes gene_type:complete
MSIADEVANLVEENARLRAALTQVVSAISGAAEALQGNAPAPKNETPVVTEEPEPEPPAPPEPEPGKVERKGVEGGAYRVSAGDVLGGRMI